ncbi:hypothetical protein ACJ2A9_21715 [Anaerobacillus sp. MEB173]|uniref:hypothetical protein n=1 Tax=Anaerobacillus sp. MEB173 TaxID=3383345 RepID=UPI003F914651
MRKLLSLIVMIILLSGCSTELTFSEVSEEAVHKEIRSFINGAKDENGVYLYFDNQELMYVYLNGTNVNEGEMLVHFTDFDVEGSGDTMDILYRDAETTDISDQSLHYELLYKVKINKEYETIRLFRNDEEVSFGGISGN